MQSQELENLTLMLIHDADEPEMWIDRWAISYPTVHVLEASTRQSSTEWQQTVNMTWQQIQQENVAVVTHGTGVAAWLTWFYEADINVQRRIQVMMLVSPIKKTFVGDAQHILRHVHCPCSTAFGDWQTG